MKHNKKVLSLVMAAIFAVTALAAGIIAYAANTPVAINAINFPDENFRTIVSMECDTDEDGYLSEDEISGVTLFSVTGYLYDLDEDAEIESIKGIEFFTNLKTLRCGGIGLTSLNVSKLTGLTWLDCMGNDIETLDVTKNTALRTLNCQSNDLDTLDVTKNTALVTLSCSVNHLTALDVSKNTLLQTLQCHQNQLTELNLSANTALTSLHCSNNHLQELDLSGNTLLENVTTNRIGEQTISGEAIESDGTIFVTMPFNYPRRILSTSIDPEDTTLMLTGYQSGSFLTDDYEKLKDGIDYNYDTGLEGTEPMTVHVDVIRNFFIVCFYTNENQTTLMDKQIVYRGEDATAPDIISSPQCKTFVSWSDSFTNIQEDKDIYATWRDTHIFRVVDFGDNTVIMACLNGCGTEREYSFAEMVGAEYGDSNYNEAFDLNSDGIINGRDLAMLKSHQF